MTDPTPDPFFDAMFERMSPGARYTFTPQQLNDIRRAFGARSWGRHSVDLRLSLPLLFRSYYIVLLLGPERRHVPRLRLRLGRYALACLMGLALVGLMVRFL